MSAVRSRRSRAAARRAIAAEWQRPTSGKFMPRGAIKDGSEVLLAIWGALDEVGVDLDMLDQLERSARLAMVAALCITERKQ